MTKTNVMIKETIETKAVRISRKWISKVILSQMKLDHWVAKWWMSSCTDRGWRKNSSSRSRTGQDRTAPKFTDHSLDILHTHSAGWTLGISLLSWFVRRLWTTRRFSFSPLRSFSWSQFVRDRSQSSPSSRFQFACWFGPTIFVWLRPISNPSNSHPLRFDPRSRDKCIFLWRRTWGSTAEPNVKQMFRHLSSGDL